MRAWVLYSLARLGVFLAAFGVIWLLLGPAMTAWWWLAALCSAIIALCISYLFLGSLRARVAEDLAARAARRGPARDVDAEAEDTD